jgi:hypothetical protein
VEKHEKKKKIATHLNVLIDCFVAVSFRYRSTSSSADTAAHVESPSVKKANDQSPGRLTPSRRK